MPEKKDFKRLARTRMRKTGESFTLISTGVHSTRTVPMVGCVQAGCVENCRSDDLGGGFAHKVAHPLAVIPAKRNPAPTAHGFPLSRE